MGVSNNAYVIRADIDPAALEARTDEQTGALADGTYWHNPDMTNFGLFVHNGTDWEAASTHVLDDAPVTGNVETINASGYAAPSNIFGSVGDFAVVTSTSKVTYWTKVGVNWVLLGDIGSLGFHSSRFASNSKIRR